MEKKIADWYRWGLWTEAMVQQAVEKGVLTQAEADKITAGQGEVK